MSDKTLTQILAAWDERTAPKFTDGCEHCWHTTRDPILVVLKDGHTHQTCCHCRNTRQIHKEHAWNR